MSLPTTLQPEDKSGRPSRNGSSKQIADESVEKYATANDQLSDQGTESNRPSLGPGILTQGSSSSTILSEISPPHELWGFNALLIEVANGIDDNEFKQIKAMYRGRIPNRTLSALKTPIELFEVMRKEVYLSPVNLLQLEGLLWRIQRFDLLNMVIDFAKNSKDVIYLQHASESPVNGYKFVTFHVRGKEFGEVTHEEVLYLRSIAANVVLVPSSFVLIDGINPSKSVVVTLLFPDQDAKKLKDMLIAREAEVTELIEFGVDSITIGETKFPIAGEQVVSPGIFIQNDIDINIRLQWENKKVKNLQKENEKLSDIIMELKQKADFSQDENECETKKRPISGDKTKHSIPETGILEEATRLNEFEMEKPNEDSLKENWLKGVFGLGIVRKALIPALKNHYSQRVEELDTGNDHLKHLLYLAAKGKLKKTFGKGSIWNVNCPDCKPILKEIEKSHIRPASLMWMNNKNDNCPIEYRLARIYMQGGKEESRSYSDLESFNTLEIIRNDTTFGIGTDGVSFLLMFRSRLMHSITNSITDEEWYTAFAKMKTLLESDMFRGLQECVSALKELEKLKKLKIICEVDESNQNWKPAKTVQRLVNEESCAFEHMLKKVALEKEKNQKGNIESQLSYQREEYQTNFSIAQTDGTELTLKEKEDSIR